MDDLFVAAVAAVAALIGFGAHAVAMRFQKKTPEPVVQVTTSAPPVEYTINPVVNDTSSTVDEHDWHIRGKVEGKVIQYCLLCGAERERP